MNTLVEFVKGKVVLLSRVPIILRGLADGVLPDDGVTLRQLTAATGGGHPLPPFAASTVLEPFTGNEDGSQNFIPSSLLNIIETFPQGTLDGNVYGNLLTTVSRGSYWGDINVEYILGGDAQVYLDGLVQTIDEGQVQAMATAMFPFEILGTHSVTVRVSANGHVIENVVSLTVEENGSGSGSGGGPSSFFANFQGPFNVGGLISFTAECFNVHTEPRAGMPPFFAIRLEESPKGLNSWSEVGYFQTYNGFPVNGPITVTSNIVFPPVGDFDYRLVGYDNMFQEVYSSIITTFLFTRFVLEGGPHNAKGKLSFTFTYEYAFGDINNEIHIQRSPTGLGTYVDIASETIVNGLPFGGWTLSTIVDWSDRHGYDYRFVIYAANGVPVYSSVQAL